MKILYGKKLAALLEQIEHLGVSEAMCREGLSQRDEKIHKHETELSRLEDELKKSKEKILELTSPESRQKFKEEVHREIVRESLHDLKEELGPELSKMVDWKQMEI